MRCFPVKKHQIFPEQKTMYQKRAIVTSMENMVFFPVKKTSDVFLYR